MCRGTRGWSTGFWWGGSRTRKRVADEWLLTAASCGVTVAPHWRQAGWRHRRPMATMTPRWRQRSRPPRTLPPQPDSICGGESPQSGGFTRRRTAEQPGRPCRGLTDRAAIAAAPPPMMQTPSIAYGGSRIASDSNERTSGALKGGGPPPPVLPGACGCAVRGVDGSAAAAMSGHSARASARPSVQPETAQW